MHEKLENEYYSNLESRIDFYYFIEQFWIFSFLPKQIAQQSRIPDLCFLVGHKIINHEGEKKVPHGMCTPHFGNGVRNGAFVLLLRTPLPKCE